MLIFLNANIDILSVIARTIFVQDLEVPSPYSESPVHF